MSEKSESFIPDPKPELCVGIRIFAPDNDNDNDNDDEDNNYLLYIANHSFLKIHKQKA